MFATRLSGHGFGSDELTPAGTRRPFHQIE